MTKLTSKTRKLGFRQRLILFLTYFMGLIGFNVLLFSERLVNRRNNKFFDQFPESFNYNENLDYYNDIKLIFSSRFGNKINEQILNFLISVYADKVQNRPRNELIVEGVRNFFTENKLNVENSFLISKYLSRCGYFSLANSIEEKVKKGLLLDDFGSFYELFLKIKMIIYSDLGSIEDYLKRVNLESYFNKFFNLNILLEKSKYNCTSSNESLCILGPLREISNLKEFSGKNIALIKPNHTELDLVFKDNLGKTYLYTSEPLQNFELVDSNKYNVIFKNEKKIDNNLINVTFKNYSYLLVNGFPNAVQRVLFHQIFHTENKCFSVHYSTFYLSDNLYSPNYSRNKKDPDDLKRFKSHQVHDFVWRMGWHDLLSNFNFTKFLYQNNFLIGNSEFVEKVLKLSNDDYAEALERLYYKSE